MNWKELLTSKKFKVLVATVTGIILMDLAVSGALTVESIDKIYKLVMAYLGAQGIADLGKGLVLAKESKS